jgi:23S rRNA pseudouridine1911/1915/1917 synthase
MPAARTVAEPSELLPYLFASHPEVKRTKVRQWLKFGSVLVNGVATTQFNQPLKPGDKVEIRADKASRIQRILPAGMRIVFEDAHLIVIEKPENLLSIASEAEREETAYAYLTEYVKQGKENSRERIWIVHRLDRETSGIMIFAKTMEVKEILQQNWDAAEKRYLAVVEGLFPEDSGTLHSHLDENSPFKVYEGKPSERTREAITEFRVLKRGKDRSLIELTLITGRRHQLRVQLAGRGFPIIGDEKYEAKTDPAKRLGLHSAKLSLPHPITAQPLSFDSPLPLDLVRLG